MAEATLPKDETGLKASHMAHSCGLSTWELGDDRSLLCSAERGQPVLIGPQCSLLFCAGAGRTGVLAAEGSGK